MRFRRSWVGLSAALALPFLACGGLSFVVVEQDGGGGANDGASPIDAGPHDSGGVDVVHPADVGVGPDEGTDTGADTGGPRTCPIPATIADGGACTALGLDCPSAAPIYTCGTGQVTGYASCTCALGHWSCPQPTCVEAGAPPPSCPLTRLVREGAACASPGEDCPGDATTCGGTQTFYDVFQCTKALLWTRIVATSCGEGG